MRCCAAVFGYKSCLRASKNRRFPCKIPCLQGNRPGDGRDQHCVASQPLAQLKIASTFWAKTLQFAGFSHIFEESPDSGKWQLWRESPESLQAKPQKLLFRRDFQRRQLSIPLGGRGGRAIEPKFERERELSTSLGRTFESFRARHFRFVCDAPSKRRHCRLPVA